MQLTWYNRMTKVYHFTVRENEASIKKNGLKAACDLGRDHRLPRESLEERKKCVFAWIKPDQDKRNFGTWSNKVAFELDVDPKSAYVGNFDLATKMLTHCYTDQKTADCDKWTHLYQESLQPLNKYLKTGNRKTGDNPEVLILEDIPPEKIRRVPYLDIKRKTPMTKAFERSLFEGKLS